ncbi:MAG TPA: LuxR C-terminal-related transcriptional regulator [Trebonia sp.]|jgi:DNA-binding CsgD family transcriptional regulator|nr:LuxR C-terminal-related transcriptional regulator [Trebonia sp.]
MPAIRGNFVRVAEWGLVREFVTGAASREEPAALVIEGEAGAGKSRLWRAGVGVAAEAERLVLRSEPSAGEADQPFAALSDLLAGVLPAAAAVIPGPQREALEVALLRRAAGQQPPTPHAVGLGTLAALRSCVAGGPVLVAIDDVQWLDAGSLEVLKFALRRISAGSLSLLLAARTDAPADPLTVGAPPLSRDWRELLAAWPAAERITLGPLDARQIQGLLPAGATAGQVRAVTHQSRGNPFWAREVWTGMAAGETAGQSEPAVPPRARAALTDRLRRSLSRPAAEALTVVSAAGRITLTDAISVLDDVPDPAAALDAAVIAGVVVETEGRVVPAHPLIGAAAVDAVPPARRALLYQRLAAVSASPERRAHFAALAAGPGPDPEVAAILDAAAASAYARAANAAAGQFAAQAAAFTPASDPAERARRLIRAGELLFLAGDVAGSVRHLQALDAEALDNDELERALPLLVDETDLLVGSEAASAVITRVLASVGDDSRRRAIVLAPASDILYGIRDRRADVAREAISCAEDAGEPANGPLHRALLNLAVAKVSDGDGLDTSLLDRAARLEPRLSAMPLQETADLHRGLWSRYVDDLATSRAALHRCVARARETGEDLARTTFLSFLALTEELAGDFGAAAAALEEAEEVSGIHDWPGSPWMLEPRYELLIAAGDLDAARRFADEFLPADPSRPESVRFMGAFMRGKAAAWRGEAAAALPHLELAAGLADDLRWADPGVRSRVDHLLAEAYVGTWQLDSASRVAERLRAFGNRQGRPTLIGDACRIDALAAAARGSLELATEAASAAVAAHEQSPLRPELARSLLVLGRIERRRKARGASRATLRRARELAAEMGHQPLLAQIDAELPRTAASRPGSELTAAERRVAEQIAGGATSREAAAELFISVRTVDTHVASIYRKLGVRSRSELRRALSGERA